jgi:hypothetical protein
MGGGRAVTAFFSLLNHALDLSLSASLKGIVRSTLPVESKIRISLQRKLARFLLLYDRKIVVLPETRGVFTDDRDNGKRFIVRADEKLTAFLELESETVEGHAD